ncbi:uncharacterized protein LOC113306759 isoform X2 [Papaver somniferum]|uniref:uncharacterized protein LOC113306759 isoform X2 n=1 Tax=Papaver somniferum TaxID=3469 RepID=UPI000E704E02|nr:uncharacterized protein LOC113306759 isoform X2 [Papaver somniferum]
MRTMVLSQVPPMECLREMLLKYPALIKLLVYISKHELKRLVINGYELEDDFGEDEIAYQIGETTEILSRGSLCTAPHCVRFKRMSGTGDTVMFFQLRTLIKLSKLMKSCYLVLTSNWEMLRCHFLVWTLCYNRAPTLDYLLNVGNAKYHTGVGC